MKTSLLGLNLILTSFGRCGIKTKDVTKADQAAKAELCNMYSCRYEIEKSNLQLVEKMKLKPAAAAILVIELNLFLSSSPILNRL